MYLYFVILDVIIMKEAFNHYTLGKTILTNIPHPNSIYPPLPFQGQVIWIYVLPVDYDHKMWQ